MVFFKFFGKEIIVLLRVQFFIVTRIIFEVLYCRLFLPLLLFVILFECKESLLEFFIGNWRRSLAQFVEVNSFEEFMLLQRLVIET
jgi:hypothetical protein